MVLRIALPMTVAYLTTPLIGIADTAIVGQLGDAALLGGLAAGAIVFDVVFASFNFLRSGTTGLVSQAYGSRDRAEEQAIFLRALILALLIGAALIVLGPVIATVGAWFIAGEPRVTEALQTYVLIRLWSAPLALGNYAILGYVLGRGEGGVGLALQFAINATNIALSVWLGLWLGWGLEGVAWGTVLGEAFGFAVGIAVLTTRFGRRGPLRPGALRDMARLKAMLVLNRDIMIRSFALLAAFALLARQGAQLGTATLAANAVLMNFFLVASYFLDGFATAAEQLAGRAVGARWRPAFDRAVRLTATWGFALAGLLALAVLIFGDQLIALITTAPEVRDLAATYLPWVALTAVTAVLAFQMDGIFIGATWSRDMRNMMLLSLALYVAALFTLGPLFGNHGLWAALHLFLLARGLSLLAVLPRRAAQTFDQGA
ncbi:MATE family efflux transporter [Mesorhizobium sp. YIM 152430]|uniref:MATE family efflux transporter n=1 Tax=Mesorhizobium sp. YIM 152430 TaxID=3031761 RepID=UPI0023DC9356|nr:MATE family efflux transporter [Mesorhizobium sp. YIM 152430]MDF1599135.1 MATE family efflux transporter [Mesorhizobium sp. YIM 152430]